MVLLKIKGENESWSLLLQSSLWACWVEIKFSIELFNDLLRDKEAHTLMLFFLFIDLVLYFF